MGERFSHIGLRRFAPEGVQEYHAYMASRPGPPRTLSSVSLIGALVLSRDEAAAFAVCGKLRIDSCHADGERAPHSPVRVPPPGPAIAAETSTAGSPAP